MSALDTVFRNLPRLGIGGLAHRTLVARGKLDCQVQPGDEPPGGTCGMIVRFFSNTDP